MTAHALVAGANGHQGMLGQHKIMAGSVATLVVPVQERCCLRLTNMPVEAQTVVRVAQMVAVMVNQMEAVRMAFTLASVLAMVQIKLASALGARTRFWCHNSQVP